LPRFSNLKNFKVGCTVNFLCNFQRTYFGPILFSGYLLQDVIDKVSAEDKVRIHVLGEQYLGDQTVYIWEAIPECYKTFRPVLKNVDELK